MVADLSEQVPWELPFQQRGARLCWNRVAAGGSSDFGEEMDSCLEISEGKLGLPLGKKRNRTDGPQSNIHKDESVAAGVRALAASGGPGSPSVLPEEHGPLHATARSDALGDVLCWVNAGHAGKANDRRGKGSKGRVSYTGVSGPSAVAPERGGAAAGRPPWGGVTASPANAASLLGLGRRNLGSPRAGAQPPSPIPPPPPGSPRRLDWQAPPRPRPLQVPASVPRCPAPGHCCRPCLGQPVVPGGGLAPAAPRPGRSLAFEPVGGRPLRPRASPQGLRRVPGPLPPLWPGLPAPGRSCACFSASRVCVACSAQRPPPRSAPCRTPRCCGRGGFVAVRAVSVPPHRLSSADFLRRGPELPAWSDAAECRNRLPVCQSGLPRTPSEATRSSVEYRWPY
ncbi:WAS/WASL-interacting protein family member 3-like [Pan paniscus]|uniref:WAS/WASL-interacting protein family member 3-like n=1 Tax=Pan paniscus TaxID=9597 RepID=UPI00300497E8